MKMAYGPHHGKEIFDLPSSYLSWIIENIKPQTSDYNKVLVLEASQEYNFREEFGMHFEDKDGGKND